MAAAKRSFAMMPVESKMRVLRLTPSANSPMKLSHAGMTNCAAVFHSVRKFDCLLQRYSYSWMICEASESLIAVDETTPEPQCGQRLPYQGGKIFDAERGYKETHSDRTQ